MQAVSKIIFWTLLVSSLLPAEALATNATVCNYFASPNGGGNGSSPSSPFKISNFWSVAGPGKVLCLLDGVYTDTITPPQNLNGTASARITVKALNDGGVRINGEGVRIPVHLKNSDYFIIEGINAHSSSSSVVLLNTGADNNIVRRVVAWDASATANSHVFSITGNTGNLLEDVAGFGSGRKTFTNSQGGNNVTIRRAWGRWENSTRIGPKMTYSLLYNSFNARYENVIGTWSTDMGGGAVDQPFGILAMDGNPPGGYCANSIYLGSIAYLRSSDTMGGWVGGAFGSRGADCVEFKDIISYIEPGSHTRDRPILGQLFDGGSGVRATCQVCNRRFTNVTEIGGAASSINTGSPNGWTIANRVKVDTIAAMNAAKANPFQSSAGIGARVCKRYENGTLTSTPLWPWPMNQRIIDAMKTAGKTPVDVTGTLEGIFGPIPTECRRDTISSSSSVTIETTSP